MFFYIFYRFGIIFRGRSGDYMEIEMNGEIEK